ncbi:hypothetical protein [Chryseosolibacter indicus]|uniref:Uncharacterized protein n=1 Tax=Chryseosolibacter indicus TaxID=2782351 RepID=A0ABS5VPH1_9BACT|nr:hypothetical protein [Chryseosolibacter indicus]MBT1702697.1 hypothetical protein [Chryseosolibacter indicus]
MIVCEYVFVSWFKSEKSLELSIINTGSLEVKEFESKITGFIFRGLEIKPYDDASIG